MKVDPDFKFGETNASANFIAKFPLGKVPAFESSSGITLFESNAIAHFVGNTQLQGATPEAAALVQQWISFADNEILPAACTWVFPCLGITQFNKQDTERAKGQITKALTVLNDYLLTRTYLVGENVTQADISLACNLLALYENVLDPEFRKPFQNVNRWFCTIINQPNVKAVIGELTLCTKMAQFDSKKYAELHGAQGGQKKEKKEKQEKPTKEKQEKPAKEKQTPKKKEAEPPQADEDEEAKPKESKDPFAAYPKGTFDMDEFKRVYSNEDTLTVAIPYFWDKFDKENYSIWYCEYQEDLSKFITFMSCNLVSGMFQRLEKLNKNAFASMCIFGENHQNQIAGLWIWRTQELVFTLNPDWQVDYESYSWKKLDPDAPETKEMVKEFFLWEGNFGGKKFNQGKVFK